MGTRVAFLSRCAAACAVLCAALATLAFPAAGADAGSRSLVANYADALGSANPSLTPGARHEMAERLLLLSSYYRMDARLLAALVTVESSWHLRATSASGALGLGQLMPTTASALAVDPREPYENLDGTARYLRRLLARFSDRDPLTQMRLAVASYNAGPDTVARYGTVPPYRETRAYVDAVMAQWRRLAVTLALPAAGAWEALGTATRIAARVATAPAQIKPHVRHKLPKLAARKVLAMKNVRHRSAHRRIPVRTRYVVALEPNLVVETPAPVRWETSHSLIARLFGLRHRVAPAPSVAAVASR